MAVMFAEKLNSVFGHLVANVKTDGIFLAYLMQNGVISMNKRKEIERVRKPSFMFTVAIMSISVQEHNIRNVESK